MALIEPHQDPYCAVHSYLMKDELCSCFPHGEVFPKNLIKPLWVPYFALQRLTREALEAMPGTLIADAMTMHGLCVELEEYRKKNLERNVADVLNENRGKVNMSTKEVVLTREFVRAVWQSAQCMLDSSTDIDNLPESKLANSVGTILRRKAEQQRQQSALLFDWVERNRSEVSLSEDEVRG
jgi:hypothetical protein